MPASAWTVAASLDANRATANDSHVRAAAIRFARIVVLELDLKPALFDERDRVGVLDTPIADDRWKPRRRQGAGIDLLPDCAFIKAKVRGKRLHRDVGGRMRRKVRDALCPRSGPVLKKGRVSGDFSHQNYQIVPCFERHQIRSTDGCERSRHGPGAYLQRNAATRRYPSGSLAPFAIEDRCCWVQCRRRLMG
jgi:hypothetical protein